MKIPNGQIIVTAKDGKVTIDCTLESNNIFFFKKEQKALTGLCLYALLQNCCSDRDIMDIVRILKER